MIATLAASIGMHKKGRDRWGPCPSCRADRTSADARPPVRIRRDWWTCYACGEWGDAVSMAGAFLGHGTKLRGRAFVEAKALVDGHDPSSLPPEPEPKPAKALPVGPVLRSATRLRDAPAPVREWLASRCISLDAPAGCIARAPEWFPRGFPIVVPAFSGSGALMSMHGRGIDTQHKTAWPMGPWPCELLMLEPRHVRPWVQGTARAPDVLVLAEGITDYLTASTQFPTIGLASGSVRALKLLKIPTTTKVYSAMDPDAQGERYGEEIADALWPIPVRPLPLRRLVA